MYEINPQFSTAAEDIRKYLSVRDAVGIRAGIPNITEDTMPGELSNIIAGRVANVFNFSGPTLLQMLPVLLPLRRYRQQWKDWRTINLMQS